MPCLPSRFAAVILAFAPLFFQRSWRHAEVLLTGASLALGKRIVTSVLRIMGPAHGRRFVNDHCVLNRAGWSGLRWLSLMLLAPIPWAGRLPGTNGRPPTKGKRLATLSKALPDPATSWQCVMATGWYGGGERVVEISTATAVWRHSRMSIVPAANARGR